MRSLAKERLEFSVLEPDIPFFRFLEDTNGDGRIDNDLPFAKLAVHDERELSPFSCKVTFDRKAGNGFARATILIQWEEGGRRFDYKVEHSVPDIPTAVTMDTGAFQAPKLEDRHIAEYLFDEKAPLSDLLVKYNVERELCLRFAEIMYLSRIMTETLVRNYDRLSKMKNSLQRDTVQGLYDIAWLHEANAITIVQGYTQLAVPVDALNDMGDALPIGDLFKNNKAGEILQDTARCADTVYMRTNDESFAMRFNFELVSACNVYMQLLTEERYRGELTYRQREGLIQKVADLCTALAQNQRTGIMLTLGGRRISLETFVDETLAALAKFVEGKDYNRAAFVREKLAEADMKSFSAHEDVTEKFELMAAVASTASDVLKRIIVRMQNWQGANKK